MSAEFPNITNFRDLSYLTNKNGLHIKQNLILRSSKLNEITPNEARKLKDVYKLSYIIDLRNPVEARQKPDLYVTFARYDNIPLLAKKVNGITHENEDKKQVEEKKKSSRPQLDKLYKDMAIEEYSITQLKTVIKRIMANRDGSSLYHCSEGKDRTGIVTLILLTILDFDIDTIFEDYLLTNRFVKSKAKKMAFQALLKEKSVKSMKKVYAIYTVDRSYLQGYIDGIIDQYGTIDDFIHLGLEISNDEIEEFKKFALVDKSFPQAIIE